MYELRKVNGKDISPGDWFLSEDDWIIVVCPECCDLSALCKPEPEPNCEHTVDEQGNISPDVICPYPNCTWVEQVKLGDWKK